MSSYKVLVTTLTCGRLDTLRESYETFTASQKIDYEHIILDQGSTDGTLDWLKANVPNYMRLTSNVGVSQGWRLACRLKRDFDFYVLVDDDCIVETENILGKMMDFYREHGSKYVLAARNETLMAGDNQEYIPAELPVSEQIPNATHRRHAGLFVCVPREPFAAFAETTHSWSAMQRCGFWRNMGYPTLVLEDLKCHHVGAGNPGQRGGYKF